MMEISMARIPEALVTDNNLLKITHALLAQRKNLNAATAAWGCIKSPMLDF